MFKSGVLFLADIGSVLTRITDLNVPFFVKSQNIIFSHVNLIHMNEHRVVLPVTGRSPGYGQICTSNKMKSVTV